MKEQERNNNTFKFAIVQALFMAINTRVPLISQKLSQLYLSQSLRPIFDAIKQLARSRAHLEAIPSHDPAAIFTATKPSWHLLAILFRDPTEPWWMNNISLTKHSS